MKKYKDIKKQVRDRSAIHSCHLYFSAPVTKFAIFFRDTSIICFVLLILTIDSFKHMNNI